MALKGKEVTWFRNSHYTAQCFYDVVKTTKEKMGIEEAPKKLATKSSKKKKLKKKKKKLRKSKKLASNK